MASSEARLPAHSQRAVDSFIARAATRIERVLSGIRAVLVSLNLVRVAWLWSYLGTASPDRAAWASAIALVSLGFSAFVLVRFRERSMPRWGLWGSVAHDITIGFVALSANPIWAGPGYVGVLQMPDVGILLLLIAASGLRLSRGAAAFGSVLGCLAFYTLVTLDFEMRGKGGPGSLHHLVFWWALFGTASVFAIVTAGTIRALVREGALAALQSERAERNLGALMRDHHDVRTQLSAAALNADLLTRSLEGRRGASSDELLSLTRELRADLAEINEYIVGIRERAHGEVTGLQGPLPVDVAKTARELFAELGRRFGSVELGVDPSCERLEVWVAGGSPTLRRVLFNLVTNACEGDGDDAARSVRVRVEPGGADDRVRIFVEDDGPGFAESVLRVPIGARATTKPAGSGLGFVVVEALLGPDAGTLRRENGPTAGARVSFELGRVGA